MLALRTAIPADLTLLEIGMISPPSFTSGLASSLLSADKLNEYYPNTHKTTLRRRRST